MKNITIDSVIFDMDGVITNSMPEHYFSWKQVLEEEGIAISQHEVYLREGQPGSQTVKELFVLHNRSYTKKIGDEILSKKESLFKQVIKTRYIQGSRTLLRNLHSQGIRLALVTGTARHEVHKILPDSIYNLFSVIVTGTDVKHGKPHPEPFIKALTQLEIEPQSAVVIENAPFGIQAAKAAGIRTIAIETSLPREYLQEADDIFSSIKELTDRINFKLQ